MHRILTKSECLCVCTLKRVVKDVQIAGDFWVVCFCQTTWDYLCNTAPHCCVFSSQHGQQQQQQQQQQVNRNSQEDKEKEEKEKEAERDEEKNDTEDKEDGMKWVAINLKKKRKEVKTIQASF